MQPVPSHTTGRGTGSKQRRYCRVQRHFSLQRGAKELVCDLLRAHWGE